MLTKRERRIINQLEAQFGPSAPGPARPGMILPWLRTALRNATRAIPTVALVATWVVAVIIVMTPERDAPLAVAAATCSSVAIAGRVVVWGRGRTRRTAARRLARELGPTRPSD